MLMVSVLVLHVKVNRVTCKKGIIGSGRKLCLREGGEVLSFTHEVRAKFLLN